MEQENDMYDDALDDGGLDEAFVKQLEVTEAAKEVILSHSSIDSAAGKQKRHYRCMEC
jgi:hypothetical protein